MALSVRRINKEIQIGRSTPAWMLTYADMMTQILIFFILLFSLSDINQLKFSGYFTRMKKPPVILDEEQLRKVMVVLADYAGKKGLEDMIRMEINEHGLNISLTEKLMFNSGSANILDAALPVLDEIAVELKTVPNSIAIEGHTDNVPIHNDQFGSNWELSTTRATNVVRYFIEKQGFSPERISASGYGEFRPIADNATVEGRAHNRRIVLIVLRQRIK
jgi:chemotaxis protein MotB